MTSPSASKNELGDRIAGVAFSSWMSLALSAIQASFVCLWVYGYFEWLFFVTKPSRLATAPWYEQVLALPQAIAFLTILVAPVLLIVVVVFALTQVFRTRRQPPNPEATSILLVAIVAAPQLALTGLVLLDNFTHTLFGFSTTSISDPRRFIYALVYLAFVASISRWLEGRLSHEGSRLRYWLGILPIRRGAIVLWAIVAASLLFPPSDRVRDVYKTPSPRSDTLPNVLILSSDGISSRYTSLAPDGPDTTPFLVSLAQESLVSYNHLPNCGNTVCSVAALLSGKSPLQTRAIGLVPFRGRDKLEHLPGVLRQLGYRGINLPRGTDHNLHGMVDAVDPSFGGDIRFLFPWLSRGFAIAFDVPLQFVQETVGRSSVRLAHIFGIRKAVDTHQLLIETPGQKHVGEDRRALQDLMEFAEAEGPFFAHVHLLGTHFSEPTDEYMKSIGRFDEYVRDMVDFLREIGKLQTTILIVTSDHALGWDFAETIPLVIRFPDGEHSGELFDTTQRTDIGPTVLDAIGIDLPPWMIGKSLIRGEPGRTRQLFAVDSPHVGIRAEPSYPNLALVASIRCQQVSIIFIQPDQDEKYLRERSGRFGVGEIVGYTRPCPPDELPSPASELLEIENALARNGWDTDILQQPFSDREGGWYRGD